MSIRIISIVLLLLSVLPVSALSKKKKKKALYSSSFLLNSQHTTYQKQPLVSKGFELYFTKQRKKQKWLSLSLGMNIDFAKRFYSYSFNPDYYNSQYPEVYSTTRYYYYEEKRSHFSFPMFVQFRLLNKPLFSLFLSTGIRSNWQVSERKRWAYYYTNSPYSAFNPGPFTHNGKWENTLQLESISPVITSEAAYLLNERYSLLARMTAARCRYFGQEFMWNIALGIKRIF
ncbi:MAG: hypothetical protein RLZZ543_950 [Bacteroidota bacterium]|jgi:hypothetical protein